jgi:hypothetical protein
MGTVTFDHSFAGGELTPEMYGRVDLAKNQSGLALCRNCLTLPHGPVINRAGTEYVNQVKTGNAIRLIPFTYSIDQTMVIEVGAGYFRFHTQAATLLNAGVPYEITNTYAQADLMDIHYVQSADVLTMVHPKYPIAELRRLGAVTWTFTNPVFAIPTYCPTAVSAVATAPTVGNPIGHRYAVTTVNTGDFQESIASNISTSINNDLTLTGNYNTISWTLPVGASAIRFNVYKLMNGLLAYIGQAAPTATSFIDDNITPDVGTTPPNMDTGFNDAPGNYPGAVSYFQQRRVFAGSTNNPQNVWMTMSGTESNLTYTIPVTAQNRVAFRIAAREASGIRHLVPVANLLLLTASCEWRLGSTDGSAVWAANLDVKPQSYIGANNVTPAVIGNSVLFSQARGGRIREMSYDWNAQSYQAQDISILAPHLFDYQQITDMAFTRAPYPVLWAASSNGTLLGMTYVPEQQVAAWHHHDFGGFVETICAITETPAGTLAPEDMLYVVVRRLIGGVTKRYIERVHTRQFLVASDAFFVDSGATNFLPGTYVRAASTLTLSVLRHGKAPGDVAYFSFSNTALNGTYTVITTPDTNTLTLTAVVVGQEIGSVAVTPTQFVSTVTGLTWLIGQTVNILADGAPVPPQVVSNTGTITLPYPATKVVVGLPIVAQVKTLPVALPSRDGSAGQSLEKNINEIWLRVFNTGGIYVGPDFSDVNLTYFTERANTDLPGFAPALFSGVKPLKITAAWQYDGSVCIQQTDPLPMTISSIALDITTE